MDPLERKLVEGKLFELKMVTGYNYLREHDQRIFGPPPYWEGPPPEKGSVLFINKLPRNCFEDEIYRVFSKIGPIYTIRTLLNYQGFNRGYAFVTYSNSELATEAIKKLNNSEIRVGCRIVVRKSFDNRTLFIGGIPKDKTKADAWTEFSKICPKFENITIYLNPKNRSLNRGFLLIEFDSYQSASRNRKYMLKNKVKLWDSEVQVSWAQQIHECSHTLTTTKIFIRNLPEKITKHRLYHQLLTMVPKESIKHIFISRHFAFINFETREYANIAKEGLSLCCIDGEMLEVHWARPAKPVNSTQSSISATCGCNTTKLLTSDQDQLYDVLENQSNEAELKECNAEMLEELNSQLIVEQTKKNKKKKKNHFWQKLTAKKKEKNRESQIQVEIHSKQEEINLDQFPNSSEQNNQTIEMEDKPCEQEANILIDHSIEDMNINQQCTEEVNISTPKLNMERNQQINEAENNEYACIEPRDHVINLDPNAQNETVDQYVQNQGLYLHNYQVEQTEYNPYLPVQNTEEYNFQNEQETNQPQQLFNGEHVEQDMYEPTMIHTQNNLPEYKETQAVNNTIYIENENHLHYFHQNLMPNYIQNVQQYGNYMPPLNPLPSPYYQVPNMMYNPVRIVYTYSQNSTNSAVINMAPRNFNQFNGMGQTMVPIIPYQYNNWVPVQVYPRYQYCYLHPCRCCLHN